jgi:hypothetical protein
MGRVLLFGLAAAVYPQLLAVVVVILTRPRPKPLLWACYLGSVTVSVAGAIAVFAVFRSRGSIAGTSAHRVGAAPYLVVGAIAVGLAAFAATRRGREALGRDRPRLRRRPRQREPSRAAGVRSRAEHALSEGSVAVAVAVGAMLAVPGPFDLLALGHMARAGYGTLLVGALIVAFTLIKFLLIEVPIVSYAIRPEATASLVTRFANWMHANKLLVSAAVVGVIGLALVWSGVSRLG